MNRLQKLVAICASQLVLFAQASWAVDGYRPLPQVQEDESTYTLTLTASPQGACTFNRNSGSTFTAGQSVYMYYNARQDYMFDYWQTGDTIISRNRYFYFTMPDHDTTLTAVFHYAPDSPGNPNMPEKKYSLTLNTKPQGAGSFNRNSGEQFAEGQSISMRAYNNTDYVFRHWTSADTVIANSSSFNYTMPSHDAELTAVYDYRPDSPANPDTAQVYYTVTLQTKPAGAGSFNWNTTTQRVANSSGYVYAYANSDYVFREWQQDGKTVGTNQRYDFTMPAENMTLVAVYDYSPANPGNPGKNYWNEETGEVIVDDFTPGSLSSAVSNTIGGSSNRDKVQMMIIAGPINQSDWGVVNNYKNCTLLDLSRTYGMTYVPSYNFSGNTVLSSVVLPAGIEKIDYYAFRNCSSLSSISILAATPPTIGNCAFEGIADSIVYVPADAIPLYQQADGWKDFTILPLAKEVSALEVNLPEGTDVNLYKDMFIELVNAKSGQKQRYVVTNRLTYTFNSLIHRTSYNIYLKNKQGDVLGEVDGIDIIDQDVSVTFPSLMVPRDLTLRVLTPSGEDVTSETTITWFDQKDTYLTKGNTLTGQLEGVNVKYRVQLPQTLGMLYQLPADVIYEVQATNSISLTLTDIPQTTISGVVRDVKTGQALSGATVAVSQMLNGLYSKSFTTKTDNQGRWSLQVYEAKTDITASMDDYVSKTQTFEAQAIVGGDLQSPTEIPTFELKDISGTTISLNLTYTGTNGETQEFYSDYANVAYTVFNETMGQQVTELNVQYPQIVLMEQLPAGTVLRVTATSKNQKFMPVTATATVDSLDRASVTLPIKQLGGITASFRQTDNPSVTAILYNANGLLLKKYDYASASLTISELQDGQYTLVSMANSQFFNSIGSVSQFAEAGLREGIDYVKNTVTVRSGEMAVVENQLIPFLDESKLYYTGDGTSITVNKSQITTGNYLTITGKIDFKPAYANNVSDVKLIVNLPEEVSFVENSVMRGSITASYTYADNQVVVPLDYYGERVRFCFIPTAGGNFAATAQVQFTLKGKTFTQPIGNVNFTVQNLSISVPSAVAKTTVPVSGTAPGKSTVEIYDGSTLIGQTTALANGSWSTTVELEKPYNLSTHSIFAKLTTANGLEMLTETKDVLYDMTCIEAKTVTMSFYNGYLKKNIEVVFDLQNKTIDQPSYMFYTTTDITFVVDLTNNDTTVVNDVTIRVYTDKNNWRNLKASYDVKSDRWVAVSPFGSNELPVGVDVMFNVISKEIVQDRDYLTELLGLTDVSISNTSKEIESISSILASESDMELSEIYDELYSILSGDVIDVDKLDDLLGKVMDTSKETDYDEELLDEEITKFYLKDEVLEQEYKNSLDSICNSYFINSELKDFILPTNSFCAILDNEEYKGTYKIEQLNDIETEQLILNGYNRCSLTDNTDVYFKFANDEISFVDAKTSIKYTLNLERETIANNSRRRISSTFDFENFAGCLSAIKDGTSTIRNFSSNTIDAKSECQRVVDVLSLISDGISCFYMSTYGQFQKMLNDVHAQDMAKANAEIESLEDLARQTNSRIIKNEKEISNLNKAQKSIEENCNALSELMNSTTISESERTYYQNEFNKLDNQWKTNNVKINNLKKGIDDDLKAFQKIQERIGKLNLQKLAKEEGFINATSKLWRMPARLTRGAVTISKTISTLGKLAGPLGVLIEAWSLFCDLDEGIDEINEWIELIERSERYFPCENDSAKLESICDNIKSDAQKVKNHVCSILVVESDALVLDIASLRGFNIYVWLISGFLNGYGEISKNFILGDYIQKRGNYYIELMNLKCKKEKCPRCGKDPCVCKDKCPRCGNRPCTCPDKCPKCGQNPCVCPPPYPQIPPIHDPSGYVYEGVASNRLQGVTATAYYKETVEDMYGDLHENVVLWNAEEYAQQNPLFTDEYGMYQWDVPQGLWQVKFEKEGYQTTYSEWLPVPPPQLEVNIPMTQLLQPSVASAKAYSEGVEVTFDKYMNPETLTADHIIVTRNGAVADGTVELLNEEVAYEGKSQTYASKVRFTVPEDAPLLSTDEVMLTVKKTVESYAGMQMQDTYTQAFDVEPRVTSIVVDSLINVAYGGERTLTVAALPADASKGKTMHVQSLSTMIATTDSNELTLDENGQAELKVSGELPGSTVISFTIDDTDVTGSMTVNVKDATNLVTMAPRASRVSGTEVYYGTEIRLTSETEGAVIYYTLDGSCPCNTETALVYDPETPIVIAGDSVTIKAMAQGHDLEESEVSEFTYRLKTTALGYQLPTGWTWISHNIEEAVPASKFQTGAERIVSQTEEIINDPKFGFVGTLQELQPVTAYKVQQKSEGNVRLSGYEWNVVSKTVPVETGWNWIGYPLNQVMTVSEALDFFTPSEGDYIVGQNGFAEYASGQWHGTLEGMMPGEGFLYKSAETNEIPFNTAIVSTAASRLGKKMLLMGSPWSVDKHAYPNVTSLTAWLYNNGVRSTDGEFVVAAFSDSECRGIGQWIEGRLMMNVYGEGGEKLHFLAFDPQTENVYDISEAIAFASEPVGNWNMPYVLTIGSETVGINELYSELTVTPRVAYDYVSVSAGGRIISHLSLTDMSGRTVFSMSANDRGATIATSQLPEGIYIVAVVADGQSYYQKIVKRNK